MQQLKLDLFPDDCSGCRVSLSLVEDAERSKAERIYALCDKEHRFIYLSSKCLGKIREKAAEA